MRRFPQLRRGRCPNVAPMAQKPKIAPGVSRHPTSPSHPGTDGTSHRRTAGSRRRFNRVASVVRAAAPENRGRTMLRLRLHAVEELPEPPLADIPGKVMAIKHAPAPQASETL